MRVVFTRAAQADLAEIGDYIALDSPARAMTFTEELIAACEAINQVPFGAPVLPRYEREGYRRKVHKRYLIIYRVHANTIEVVRVVHGGRDIERLLDPQTK